MTSSAKTPFPIEVTFTSTGNQDLNVSFWGTQLKSLEDSERIKAIRTTQSTKNTAGGTVNTRQTGDLTSVSHTKGQFPPTQQAPAPSRPGFSPHLIVTKTAKQETKS